MKGDQYKKIPTIRHRVAMILSGDDLTGRCTDKAIARFITDHKNVIRRA
jgi:hypothetical protein